MLPAPPFEHRRRCDGLKREAVVAVQHRIDRHRDDALDRRFVTLESLGTLEIVGTVKLPDRDLAAVQVRDHVQMQTAIRDGGAG